MGWIVEVVRATRVVDRTWMLLSFEAVSVDGVHVGNDGHAVQDCCCCGNGRRLQ